MSKIAQTVIALLAIAAASLAGYAGYRLVRSELAAEVYKGRLERLTQDYQELQKDYNTVVKKTAVTELDVRPDGIDVIVRTAEGEIERIPTAYQPDRAIWVSYVVVDGRLMIWKIFDDDTAPSAGQTIDPQSIEVELTPDDDGGFRLGISRPLTPGRWVVKTSGEGALRLVRADPSEDIRLVHRPEVRDYDPVEKEIDAAHGKVGPVDVLKELVGLE